MGAGCKPAGFCLRWFESNTLHRVLGSNASGGTTRPRWLGQSQSGILRPDRAPASAGRTTSSEKNVSQSRSVLRSWAPLPTQGSLRARRGPSADFRGSSSVGRASAFQAERREFESRLPLSIPRFVGPGAHERIYDSRGPEPANGIPRFVGLGAHERIYDSRGPEPANVVYWFVGPEAHEWSILAVPGAHEGICRIVGPGAQSSFGSWGPGPTAELSRPPSSVGRARPW